MTSAPEQWRRLKKVFEGARMLPAGGRAEYLVDSCEGDEALRREVESLLISHDRANSFLETPPVFPIETNQRRPIHENDDALCSGATVDRYRITRSLAKGGMGHVYLAEDTRLGRQVALKLLPPETAEDPERLHRFEREARLASSLNHPNVAQIYDLGEFEGRPFIVMEYVEGSTLDAAGARPLRSELVSDIAAQVCHALGAAHAKGIVHRDLKPLNVMLTPLGHVKVLDFGIATFEHSDIPARNGSPYETRTGQIMGTLPFMSPEQVSGERVGGASDIFSLGVILYWLATGRHPFMLDALAGQPQVLIHAILTQQPLPPHRHHADIWPALEDLILRMLQKDPGLRPTAAEVRRLISDRDGQFRAARGRAADRQMPGHIVGRRRESALLDEAFEEAAAGRPLLLTVAGEPGIGKTTVVEEFLFHLNASGRSYVARGRCSERLAGSEAYLPVLEALDSLLTGDGRHAGAYVMAQCAPTWYAQIAPESAATESAPGVRLELKNASQERMKRELRGLLAEASRVKPLVLFFDDLHWADLSTVDLLGYLCTQFGSMRLLIVVTYRPTDLLLAKHPFVPLKLELLARGHCREIRLDFLSRDEAASYLDLEFPGHDFPTALAAVIHEKTEGSPLFMVNLVRDLRDRQVIVRVGSGWRLAQSIPALERDLPESVRSMIERKIAQLSEEDRQLLVCASVQGHSFDSAVVARALGRDPGDVEERLEVLDRVHAFVRVISEDELPDATPTLRCCFVHVLYQNALYGSLKVTRRISLSAAIARVMIGFYGQDNPTIASELALLLEAGRDGSLAARYFLLASQNALRVSAFVEAATIAERGLQLLSVLPENADRNARELKLQIALGTAWVAIKGYAAPDVGRAYGRARELCRTMGDAEELAAVLFGLFVYYLVVPSFRTAMELGDEMLAVAAREDSQALRVQGLLMRGMVGFWRGDVEFAVRELEEGIGIYETQRWTIFGKTPLFDHGVGSRRYQALCLWLHGYPDRAVRRSEEALADARDMSHPLTLASAMSFDSMLRYFVREPALAGERAAAAVACTREYVLTYWLGLASALHGWSVAQLADSAAAIGSWEEGTAQIRASLDSHLNASARTFRTIGCALLGETYLIRGRFEEAAAALDEGLRTLEETDERFWEAELHRLRGELLLANGSGLDDQAEDCFERAIAVAHQKKEKSLELRAAMSLYRLVLTQTKPSDRAERLDMTRARLADAYESFTEGFNTADLRDAKALLERL